MCRASPGIERRIVTPQAEALDKGGLDLAGQTESAHSLAKLVGGAERDVLADVRHAAPPFDNVGVEQSSVDRPTASALTS